MRPAFLYVAFFSCLSISVITLLSYLALVFYCRSNPIESSLQFGSLERIVVSPLVIRIHRAEIAESLNGSLKQLALSEKKLGDYLIEKSRFSESLPYLRLSRIHYEQAYGKNNSQLLPILTSLGDALQRTDKCDEGIEVANERLKLLEASTTEEIAKTLIDLARINKESNNFVEAKVFAAQASSTFETLREYAMAKETREEFGLPANLVLSKKDSLQRYQRSTVNTTLFLGSIKPISKFEKLCLVNVVALAKFVEDTLNKEATELEERQNRLNLLSQLSDSKASEWPLARGIALAALGKFYAKNNDDDNALKQYEEAKQSITLVAPGVSGYYLSELKINSELARIYQKNRLFSKAETCHLENLAHLTKERIIEKGIVINHRQLILSQDGKYQEAIQDDDRAMMLFEKVDERNWCALMLQNRAETLRSLGRYPEAERDLLKALQLREQSGKWHQSTWGPHYKLGRYYLLTRRRRQAQQELETALRIATASFPPHHPFIAYVRESLAESLMQRSLSAAAQKELEVALPVIIKEHEVGSARVASTLQLLSRSIELQCRDSKLPKSELLHAEALLARAKRLVFESFHIESPEHVLIARADSLLGEFYLRDGQLQKADECLDRAQRLYEKRFAGYDHPALETILKARARILQQAQTPVYSNDCNDISQAALRAVETYYRRAYQIEKRIFGESQLLRSSSFLSEASRLYNSSFQENRMIQGEELSLSLSMEQAQLALQSKSKFFSTVADVDSFRLAILKYAERFPLLPVTNYFREIGHFSEKENDNLRVGRAFLDISYVMARLGASDKDAEKKTFALLLAELKTSLNKSSIEPNSNSQKSTEQFESVANSLICILNLSAYHDKALAASRANELASILLSDKARFQKYRNYLILSDLASFYYSIGQFKQAAQCAHLALYADLHRITRRKQVGTQLILAKSELRNLNLSRALAESECAERNAKVSNDKELEADALESKSEILETKASENFEIYSNALSLSTNTSESSAQSRVLRVRRLNGALEAANRAIFLRSCLTETKELNKLSVLLQRAEVLSKLGKSKRALADFRAAEAVTERYISQAGLSLRCRAQDGIATILLNDPQKSQIARAKELLIKSLDIHESSLDTESVLASCLELNQLSLVGVEEGKNSEAAECVLEASALIQKHIMPSFERLSRLEQLNAVKRVNEQSDYILTVGSDRCVEQKVEELTSGSQGLFEERAFAYLSCWQGLILKYLKTSAFDERKLFEANSYSYSVFDVSDHQVLRPAREYGGDYLSNANADGFLGGAVADDNTWKPFPLDKFLNTLSLNEAYIHILPFNYFRLGLEPSPKIAAFIVMRSKPVCCLILSAEGSLIVSRLAKWRDLLSRISTPADNASTVVRAKVVERRAREELQCRQSARDIVWKEIAGRVPSDKNRILLCLDSLLTPYPWQLLVCGTPSTKGSSQMILTELDSPEEWLTLANRKRIVSHPQTMLIVGGINYLGTPFGEVPDTAGLLLKELKDLKPTSLVAEKATRMAVLSKLKGSQQVVFSCHGILGDPRSNDPEESSPNSEGETVDSMLGLNNDPFANSGLVLARSTTKEPEILLASDFLDSDLQACELMTLAACDTGRGLERKGQGVFGLRSAIMSQNARSVLVSLWPVDPNATNELVRRFYFHLFREGKNEFQALRLAQRDLIDSEQFRLPYYWAGWTLVGKTW